MKDKIGVFYEKIGKVVGCKKVIDNLIAGCRELKIEVKQNERLPLCGCIHGSSKFFNRNLPKNCLVGPEIMVLPTEMPWVWETWDNFVQPSQWCVDYMQTFPHCRETRFYSWPIGIDTERFNERGRGKKFEFDCFVYYKNVTNQNPRFEFQEIIRELTRRKIRFKVLEYGKYNESELIKCTKDCQFGIFFTGTESQGIAYMECLSSNCPLCIIDQKTFKYQDFQITLDSISAAPYFDETCGVKSQQRNLGTDFDNFLKSFDKYTPRDFIVNNHSLKQGAQEYYDILLEVNNLK